MSVGGLQIDAGAGLAALGAAAAAFATIVGKKWLSQVPLGIYSITRTGLGTIVFYVIALILYCRYHFIEAFSPFLWQWMLLYGLIIVVCGESFWIRGAQSLPASQISVITSFTPAIGIVAAYLILGEVPSRTQYMGGGVIFLGIAIGLWGGRQKRQRNDDHPTTMQMQEMENQAGFRGI
jgi:drug/metabolite transporter (DMT)-like permease